MIRFAAQRHRSVLLSGHPNATDILGRLIRTPSAALHTHARPLLVDARHFDRRRYVSSKAYSTRPEEAPDSLRVEEEDRSVDAGPAIPWYLKVEPPSTEQNPFLDRQRLPELPENSPPILKELLDHISVDLGLDDLSLLDLRHVDPPPALGSNLIMILATARSEKHLHVSAERFCRWLKTIHKLKASADGLLGRGELKLKMRRKMRRAKILSRVGASVSTDVDDGIRTGWICVNVAGIEDGAIGKLHQDLHDDYVGFGAETHKVNLVVQMLTEEKRDGLDLESLWGQLALKPEEPSFSGNDETLSSEHEASSFEGGGLSVDDSAARAAVDSFQARSGQIRHFHLCPDKAGRAPWRQSASGSVAFTSSVGMKLRRDDRLLLCDHLRPSMRPFHAMSGLQVSSSIDHGSMQPERIYDPKNYIEVTISKDESLFPTAVECQIFQDWHSTDPITAERRLQTQRTNFLREIQATYVEMPSQILERGILALTDSPKSGKDLLTVIEAFEGFLARNMRPANNQLRFAIQNAILSSPADAQCLISNTAFPRARRLLSDLYGPASIEEELVTLMKAAEAARWDEFWHVWGSFPVSMRARPPKAYSILFLCLSKTGHQAEIMRCLRERVPEMDLEEPPVEMDLDIAQAIHSCLVAAGLNGADAAREWQKLSRRCREVEAQSQH